MAARLAEKGGFKDMFIMDDKKIERAASVFPTTLPSRSKNPSVNRSSTLAHNQGHRQQNSYHVQESNLKVPWENDNDLDDSPLVNTMLEKETFNYTSEPVQASGVEGDMFQELLDAQNRRFQHRMRVLRREARKPQTNAQSDTQSYVREKVPASLTKDAPEEVLATAEIAEETSVFAVDEVEAFDLRAAMEADTAKEGRLGQRRTRIHSQRGGSQVRVRGADRRSNRPPNNWQKRPKPKQEETMEDLEAEEELDLSHLTPLEQFKYLVQTGFATDTQSASDQWNMDAQDHSSHLKQLFSSNQPLFGPGNSVEERGKGSPAALEAMAKEKLAIQQRMGDYSHYLPGAVQALGGRVGSDLKPGEMFDFITSSQPYTPLEERRSVKDKLEGFLAAADPSLSSTRTPLRTAT